MKLDVSARFAKDLKERGLTAAEADQLAELLDLICKGRALPAYYREHSLVRPGEWQGFLECHIDTDWLLIYRRWAGRVKVFRTGTHAELFKLPSAKPR